MHRDGAARTANDPLGRALSRQLTCAGLHWRPGRLRTVIARTAIEREHFLHCAGHGDMTGLDEAITNEAVVGQEGLELQQYREDRPAWSSERGRTDLEEGLWIHPMATQYGTGGVRCRLPSQALPVLPTAPFKLRNLRACPSRPLYPPIYPGCPPSQPS